MRAIIFFLLLSLSANSSAAPDGACDQVTITTGDLDFQCDTLTIGPGTHVIPAGAPGQVLRIDVLGDVNISSGAVIVLSGGNGSAASGNTPGGVAGPGGSDGGDNTAGGPNDAPDTPNGGFQGSSDSSVCGAGGGGGGFANAGSPGTACTLAGGLGGDAYLLLSTVFRGGYGGGAGGSASNALPITSATGGGGGGSIWITANGNITINGNIDVRGGNGGSAAVTTNAGGGGGGSGGAIRITSLSQLVNNGTFYFSGGNGGNGDGAGRNGGNGSAGIYELQDADGIIYGSGTGATAQTIPMTADSLHSSISCGTVSAKEKNLFFQVMMGFFLVILLSKIRGQSRRSV